MKYTPSLQLISKLKLSATPALQPLADKYSQTVTETFFKPFIALAEDLTKGLTSGEVYQGVSYTVAPLAERYATHKAAYFKLPPKYLQLHLQRKFSGRSSKFLLNKLKDLETKKKQSSYTVLKVKGYVATVELRSGYDFSNERVIYHSLLQGVKYPPQLPPRNSNMAVILFGEYGLTSRPLMTNGARVFQKNMAEKLNRLYRIKAGVPD